MALKKVHVLLRRDVVGAGLTLAIRRIGQVSGMESWDKQRAEMFGIVSGSIEEAKISKLRELPEVEDVQQDGVQHALAT